ncbi:MAG: HNH endonuclease [Mycobacteriaceae bacterium]
MRGEAERVSQRNGRTRRERQNADNLKAARLQPCRRCGQRIDYNAAPGEPDAFNAGHIKSWHDHPELREDPANLQQEHENCNKSAGKREALAPGVTSRQW